MSNAMGYRKNTKIQKEFRENVESNTLANPITDPEKLNDIIPREACLRLVLENDWILADIDGHPVPNTR